MGHMYKLHYYLQIIFVYIFLFDAYKPSVSYYYHNLFKNEKIGKQTRKDFPAI